MAPRGERDTTLALLAGRDRLPEHASLARSRCAPPTRSGYQTPPVARL